MDRMDDRAAIAKRIDDGYTARSAVNKHPDVIAARAKADAADSAEKLARREFAQVFNAHYPSEESITDELATSFPDLLMMGGSESDTRWIARCAVTGWPVFKDDRIILIQGEADYDTFVILADAVTFSGDAADKVMSRPIGRAADLVADSDDGA